MLLIPSAGGAAPSTAKLSRVGLIRRDGVPLRAQSSVHANVLAVLIQQTQVEVLGRHGAWTQARVWASVQGWVESSEIVFRKPWSSVSTYRAPEIHDRIRAHKAQAIRSLAQTTDRVVLFHSTSGGRAATLPAGATVTVTAWQQDSKGNIWYRIRGLWTAGGAIRFQTPDPGLRHVRGMAVWRPVAGKGMWLTLGTIAESAPDALAVAAVRNGITHLYLEAAISPLGFHGKSSVGPLIEAAHRRHVAVVAWVYPYLHDLASDVELTRRVARFHTRSGDSFDGIAADLERNVSTATVRAYSQLVRAYLGPDYLLVGVTYPPQSFPGYPFAEIARQYNLIAPMDYWHQTQTSFGLDYGHMRYSYTYGYRYALDSVRAIRQASGHTPVSPLGQTFDNFGRLEMGPHAPSPEEVTGFLAGSKKAGAPSVSFFQWMTASVGEWRAIKDFRL